jgi:Fe-S cluster assembly protein SufD
VSQLELAQRPDRLFAEGHWTEGDLLSFGPAEFRRAREDAAARFIQAGIPTTKHEEWKYTSLRELAKGLFATPAHPGPGLTQKAIGDRGLSFLNGFTLGAREVVASEANGVKFCSLRAILETSPEQALVWLGRAATLEGKLGSFNDERFALLNFSRFTDGVFLFVPPGVAAEGPFHITFRAEPGESPIAQHPRVLIVVSEGASASVVESYRGEGRYFTNPVTEVILGRGAQLEHTRIQNESLAAQHLGVLAATQEADSTLISNVATFGAELSRLDVWAWIGGEHAETSLNGVFASAGSQVIDHHTRIDHAKPNCHSFEVYKGVLADDSIGVFNGKIFVYEDAQKTDAKQTNQGLLLSKRAAYNTKPQLEIFADDVKCTHGATVGRLREDALFYLRSRGIPKKEARDLMVYAFAAEVLEKIELESAKVEAERLLFEKLSRIHVELEV